MLHQAANGQLSKIINDISTTIEESANGTNDISSRIRNIASSVEAIKSQTAENQSIGNELKKNVEVFKNIRFVYYFYYLKINGIYIVFL